MDLQQLIVANAHRWSIAKLTRNFTSVAQALVAKPAKLRYQIVERATGVPWHFIAVVHERESSQQWSASLAQGDPWNQVSKKVPAGRGPFKSWEEAAIDALVNCSPFAARNKDWSVGGFLTMLERYNGLKYASQGMPSPYIWSGTDQYVRGKVLVDHGPIEPVVDVQLGCAGLLMAMMKLDPSITFGAPVTIPTSPPLAPKPTPSITAPAEGSVGAYIASLIRAIFKRRTP